MNAAARLPVRFGPCPLGLLLVLVATGCSDGPTGPSISSVQIAPGSGQLQVGENLQLAATARDASGRVVEAGAPEWSSSQPEVASVSSGGLVTGVGEGSATIHARIGGREGAAQISVVVINTPVVTSVTPTLLRPGDEAVIQGQNFHATPGSNDVRLHRTRLSVIAASETSLTVRLPDFVCGPEGQAPIVVRVGDGASDSFPHPFRPAAELEMEPGELRRIAPPDARCLILPRSSSGAEYLVGVQSTSAVASSRVTVRLDGMRGQSLVANAGGSVGEATTFARVLEGREASRAAAAPSGAVPRTTSSSGPDDRLRERWRVHRTEESSLRRAEQAIVRAMPPARPLAAFADGAGAAPPRVSSDVQAGDTIGLQIPDIASDNFCQNGRPIVGLVRRVGTRSVWIEDTENPAGGFSAEDYQLLSQAFDDVIHDEIASYFGEPTDTDGNGRVVIVISREVNRMSHGTLGFVVSTDFFPNQCPASNGGEFYYARAPDPSGSITGPDGETGDPYSRQEALSLAPILLAHEVTHVIQFGRWIERSPGSVPQAIWLLEGQATLAEEVVGHRYTGHQPGQNLGGPVALGDGSAPTNVSWYINPFIDLATYYGVGVENGQVVRKTGPPHECTWLSVEDYEPCFSGRVAYGTTWAFLRWVSDHYGPGFSGGERAFHRAMMDSNQWGLGTVGAVLGVPVPELLAPWAASLWTDGRLSGGDPLLSWPSWDLRSVDQGLVEQAHLRPDQRGFTSFDRTVQVAAASSFYQLLSSSTASDPYAFSALATDGEELPPFVQLWVVRVR